jgi:tape measure domain-containing protein
LEGGEICMSSIDERVVAMKFDNKTFEKNISESNRSISDLKKNLNFDGMKKGLSDLDLAAKNFNLNSMAQGIDNISAKFNAMSIVGIAALATIAAKAVDVGLTLAKNMIVDPAKSGLKEYETQIGAIQTILANTSSKGTTLDEVNAALDTLNTYSDKTIYNFSEMARNIGTFTAAGVSLDTSTNAIKGIANLAAVSGSTSAQASTAMYQLSQALATGRVSLMDWNSVVNAGMGGEVFQNALKETARVQGVAVDDIIAKNGSFRDSLQEGWLTTEILTETLSKFTGELTDDQLRSMGYTEEQIVGIQKMAATAVGAAQDVKTFTQLLETLGEQSASGWAQSWRIIIGDLGEAKVLWTEVSNTIGGMMQASADARNNMLKDWDALGGRTAAIDAVRNAFKALMSIVTPIQEAFREVFPPMTGQRLYEITVAVRDFTAALILGEGQMSAVKNVFLFIFTVIKTGLNIIGGLIGLLVRLFAVIFSGGDDVNILGQQIGAFFAKLTSMIKDTAWITGFFRVLGDVLVNVVGFLKDLAIFAVQGLLALAGFASGGVEAAFTRITERVQQLGMIGQWFIDSWNKLKDTLQAIATFFKPVTDALGAMFQDIGANIKEAFTDVDFDAVLDLVNVGLLGGLVLLFKKFMKDGILGSTISNGVVDQLKGLTGELSKIMSGLTDTLSAMQQNLQAGTLMKIATAIAILTAAVLVLSLIDSAALTKALTALTVMFLQLSGALAVFGKIAATGSLTQLPVAAAGLILLGIAINILVIAVRSLSELSWGEMIQGLAGLAAMLGLLMGVVKSMSGQTGQYIAIGAGLTLLAIAVKILASAVADLASMDFGSMIQGLIGMGAVLAALALFNKFGTVDKGSVVNGAGLILLATALKILASAVGDFAKMNIGALIQGLAAMGIVLATLKTFMTATANVGQMISFATGLVILGAAMKIMASAVGDFGAMPFEQLAKGLIGLGGALLVITAAMLFMPPNMIGTATALVIVGAALKIIASAFADMGGMSWDEIGRGFVVLAGSLILLAAAMYAMTGALPGAAAMLVAAAALAILTPALVAMGNMSWDEIGRGLVMLAGVFGVIGLAALVLAPVTPIILALGLAIGLIGIGIGVAAAGMLGIAVALTLLAAAGVAAIPVMLALFTAIIGLIPLLVQKIGEGIVAMAQVIGESAPVFLEAAKALIMTLLQAIQELAPVIADTLLVLITELLRIIVTAVPQMVDAGMKLIIGILEGIGKNIGKVIDAGAKVIIEFLNGLARNLPGIIQAGINLVISFINGVGDGIRNNTSRFIAAGNNLFRAIVDGVAQAIENGGNLLRWAGQRIGNAIIEGAKNALGINSPSKVFRDYIMGSVGEGVDDGAAIQSKSAYRSGEGIGEAVIDGTKSVLRNLKTAVATDMDFTPTIAPVLDLSNIKKGAPLIGGMLRPPTLSVDDSYAYASSLAVEQRSNQNGSDNGDDPTAGNGGSGDSPVTFIQNNYSPKAISAAESYRNTKNAISTAKKELTP